MAKAFSAPQGGEYEGCAVPFNSSLVQMKGIRMNPIPVRQGYEVLDLPILKGKSPSQQYLDHALMVPIRQAGSPFEVNFTVVLGPLAVEKVCSAFKLSDAFLARVAASLELNLIAEIWGFKWVVRDRQCEVEGFVRYEFHNSLAHRLAFNASCDVKTRDGGRMFIEIPTLGHAS